MGVRVLLAYEKIGLMPRADHSHILCMKGFRKVMEDFFASLFSQFRKWGRDEVGPIIFESGFFDIFFELFPFFFFHESELFRDFYQLYIVDVFDVSLLEILSSNLREISSRHVDILRVRVMYPR